MPAEAAAAGRHFVRSGKVRDLYALDAERLLLVASDRLSAFDVVLPTPIPDKGRVLTGLSRYWFRETAAIVPNHLLATAVAALPGPVVAEAGGAGQLRGRIMIGRRAQILPVEIIVRGFLAGTGWKDYRGTGALCGIPLPRGLVESDPLPEPLLTPSTKAEEGSHDVNIDLEAMETLLGGGSRGRDLARRIRDAALALYRFGAARAASVGILLADTKFEFGVLPDETLLLADEVLTPDSSRFWDAAAYEPGRPQASFDKQFVRDWLEASGWDKSPPGPELPQDVVEGTRGRYIEAFERLTGMGFERYCMEDVIAG